MADCGGCLLQRVVSICSQVGHDGETYEDLRTVVNAAVPCICTVLELTSIHGYLFDLLAALPGDAGDLEAALQVRIPPAPCSAAAAQHGLGATAPRFHSSDAVFVCAQGKTVEHVAGCSSGVAHEVVRGLPALHSLLAALLHTKCIEQVAAVCGAPRQLPLPPRVMHCIAHWPLSLAAQCPAEMVRIFGFHSFSVSVLIPVCDKAGGRTHSPDAVSYTHLTLPTKA